MQISFRTRELERCFIHFDQAVRKWGPVTAREYVKACNRLQDFDSWRSAQRFRAWRLHRLRGNRSGAWALELSGRWRLIVTRDRETGAVRIEEVSRHYGD